MTDKNQTLDNNILGYESILKLLYKFSLPAIIGMLVSAMYNVETGSLSVIALT